MKQFTVITKDGSKWLRPVSEASDTGQISNFFQNVGGGFEDLPYIGSRPDGTTVDESEAMEVRQFMVGGTIDVDDTIIEHGDWITMHDVDNVRLEADLPDFLKRTAYTDAEPECPECGKYCSCPEEDLYDAVAAYRRDHPEESHDRHISGWTHINEALPEHLETVWISNGKGFTTLGCLVWAEDGWHWAATNGVIYEEDGRIISECESDDIDVEYWHRLPDALKIDKEVKP